MENLFIYIIKSALCLAAFYPFYMLLLSRETFHRFNRIALMGILLVSFLIPVCQISIKEPMAINQAFQKWENWITGKNKTNTLIEIGELNEIATLATQPVMEQITIASQKEKNLSDMLKSHWIDIVFICYATGILCFLIRHAVSFLHLSALLHKGTKKKLPDGNLLILHKENNIAPFSWLKYIVISEKDFEENGLQILTHEQAHINNRHSWDLLIVETCVLFQWFNPVTWLLKQELQNIHEYEADETVIGQGIDAKQYQLLIIKKTVGARLYSLANSLNHSSLKKRITMMMKEKSNPWARLKYLYILPLAAASLATFAHSESSTKETEISDAKVTELTPLMKGESGKIEKRNATVYAANDIGIADIANSFDTADETMSNSLASVKVQSTTEILRHGKLITRITAKGSSDTIQKGKTNIDISVSARKPAIQAAGTNDVQVTALMLNDTIKKKKVSVSQSTTVSQNTFQVTESEDIFMVVEEMPQFPGGNKAMIQYFKNNIRYPATAQANKIEGRVLVEYVITKEGKIANTKIKKGVSPELDTEAMRVVDAMPDWTPGRQKGKAVNVKYLVPIMFKLQKTEAKPEIIVEDPSPKGDKVFQKVEEMPEFPGGTQALMEHLRKNTSYPKAALEAGIKGRVIAQFIVTKEGDIRSINIIRKVSPELDAEAIRVIKSMPKWEPGKQGGKEVNVLFTLPIQFNLD